MRRRGSTRAPDRRAARTTRGPTPVATLSVSGLMKPLVPVATMNGIGDRRLRRRRRAASSRHRRAAPPEATPRAAPRDRAACAARACAAAASAFICAIARARSDRSRLPASRAPDRNARASRAARARSSIPSSARTRPRRAPTTTAQLRSSRHEIGNARPRSRRRAKESHDQPDDRGDAEQRRNIAERPRQRMGEGEREVLPAADTRRWHRRARSSRVSVETAARPRRARSR